MEGHGPAGRTDRGDLRQPPTAEWQYDDNDMADREHTVIDPAEPDAGKRLAKAVSEWERAAASARPTHPNRAIWPRTQPPEEYAYRWRKPGDPTDTSHT